MNLSLIRSIRSLALLAVTAQLAVACHMTTEPPMSGTPVYARTSSTSGPNVTSATPAYGHEGDVSKDITITGSGFAPDAQAAWERNGVADPKIQVSTKYVSSTQLVATVTIAADADLGLYDISVTNLADRKKGIGYSLFEVTVANQMLGVEYAYDVNSNGEITGRAGVPGAFYFNQISGLDTLGGYGRAYGISDDGLTVGGGTTVNGVSSAHPYLWVNNGGTWEEIILPKNPASCIAVVRDVASDAAGSAIMAGGVENDGCYNQNSPNRKPRIWIRSGSSWIKNILPGIAKSDDVLEALTGSGIAVGRAGGKAAVWTPDGAGAWTLSQVGPSGSFLHAVRNDGTIAVGETNGVAQYWISSGGVWSGPFNLPGGCSSAVGVDDAGDILGNSCPNGNRRTPAVIAPPYNNSSVKLLGGFGSGNSVTAENISRSGQWVAGEGTVQGSQVGVYWKLF